MGGGGDGDASGPGDGGATGSGAATAAPTRVGSNGDVAGLEQRLTSCATSVRCVSDFGGCNS
ncbi:unnamed protein product [Urochloa humidicola]